VPIDSDPDMPHRARESPTAPDGHTGPDTRAAHFRQRQVVEHVRYRHDVDAAYQAYEARQAWAQAVLLQQTPHRPRTCTNGGTGSGGGVRSAGTFC